MLNRNNHTSHDNRDCNSQDQMNNQLGSQGDAIYDYERVPAGWRGFDSRSNGNGRSEQAAEKKTVAHQSR